MFTLTDELKTVFIENTHKPTPHPCPRCTQLVESKAKPHI